MPHFAFGGGWQSTFTLVNTGGATAAATLSFFGDNGEAVSLPLRFPQTNTPVTATAVTRSIPAGASLLVVVEDSGGAASRAGSAVLGTDGNIGGFAILRYNPTGQEAAVPLQAATAPSYVLAFDNTNGLSAGFAIANAAAQAATVGVTIRDDAGAQIGSGSLDLAARGHKSFLLADQAAGGWPATAGRRGTIEFAAPSGRGIAPLGLRVAPTSAGFTMTTIPVMQK